MRASVCGGSQPPFTDTDTMVDESPEDGKVSPWSSLSFFSPFGELRRPGRAGGGAVADLSTVGALLSLGGAFMESSCGDAEIV